ncbi:MAG: methyltransferase regulatory domain-containing protein [Burkholderiaceae bacterium]|jgi:SAM-dependent methyltransferase
MTDWTAGYVADIGYTYGYYTELNPLRVQLAFLGAGLMPPQVGNACELGFGQGLSINVHAAAGSAAWHGTDFNPAQAGFARELAAVSGASAEVFDDAFADFCTNPNLPQFDYIGLHGIWSWISDENRAVLVDFMRRRLAVGGVVYISYNTLPGWAAFAPMRHLMTEHAMVLGAEGRGIVNRIDEAIQFADTLLATNPLYARANPQVGERLKKLKEQNRHYLAHEYFNRDWHPMHFATMGQWLEPAKLQFACSANYLDHIDAINLTAEQQTLLNELPDPMFRQSVRDFMVNQQFRKDYWVKGARRLTVLEQAEALRRLRVVLTVPKDGVTLKVTGALGEANLSETVYPPILEALADHKVYTLGQLEQRVADKGIQFSQVLQAVQVLAGAGHLAGAQDDGLVSRNRKQTDKLNTHLLQKARSSSDVAYLASPVTGGGVNVSRFQQLFLLALAQGKKQPVEWAQFVWQLLKLQQQKLIKEGKTLETDDENVAELTAQAQVFAAQQLPVLKALQVV